MHCAHTETGNTQSLPGTRSTEGGRQSGMCGQRAEGAKMHKVTKEGVLASPMEKAMGREPPGSTLELSSKTGIGGGEGGGRAFQTEQWAGTWPQRALEAGYTWK